AYHHTILIRVAKVPPVTTNGIPTELFGRSAEIAKRSDRDSKWTRCFCRLRRLRQSVMRDDGTCRCAPQHRNSSCNHRNTAGPSTVGYLIQPVNKPTPGCEAERVCF